MKSILVALVLAALGMGCATGPYSPVKSANLDGEKLIYFEQADRIPKDVMLEAWKHQPVPTAGVVTTMAAIPPEVIAEIIKEIMAAIPEITKGYQNERMNEALLSRRMLFRGYQGEELTNINEIVKSLGWSIEYMTPQAKPYPPAVVK